MNRSDDECYHGLVAETYDLFRGDDPVEPQPWFQFYKRRLDERPGLALEPGCGTGRILLPFLQAGYSIEGVDSSEEMLAVCRRKAEALGVTPTLYQQYMQELDLPQRYTTILIPLGSFILISQRHEALEALKRFYAHLVPGGQLVFSMPSPSNRLYIPPSEQNKEWGEPHTLTRPSDGATITLKCMGWSDRLEQLETSRQYYELRDKEGKLLKAEEHLSVTRWYGKYEMIMMLESVGFRNVKVYGNHTDEEATAESWARIYWTEK
jgi:SAM-dependent methyltransferase